MCGCERVYLERLSDVREAPELGDVEMYEDEEASIETFGPTYLGKGVSVLSIAATPLKEQTKPHYTPLIFGELNSRTQVQSRVPCSCPARAIFPERLDHTRTCGTRPLVLQLSSLSRRRTTNAARYRLHESSSPER